MEKRMEGEPLKREMAMTHAAVPFHTMQTHSSCTLLPTKKIKHITRQDNELKLKLVIKYNKMSLIIVDNNQNY